MINITFSKFVKMNGRLWEVNFRKLARPFFVFYADTSTLQGERIPFQLLRDETAGWKIEGRNLPTWLLESVQQLATAIEIGLQEFNPWYPEDRLEIS